MPKISQALTFFPLPIPLPSFAQIYRVFREIYAKNVFYDHYNVGVKPDNNGTYMLLCVGIAWYKMRATIM